MKMGQKSLELKYLNKTFGYLTIVKIFPIDLNSKKRYCEVNCVCGNIRKRLLSYNFKTNSSCGCKIFYSDKSFIKSAEYKTWQNIKNRCFNKNSPDYFRYGGRGIKMCITWVESFEVFLNDMGNKPSTDYSIDRVDNNGDYCKENCKWSTRTEQSNNRRSNVLLTKDGITKNIAQWCKILGLRQSTVEERFKKGWTHEDCLKLKKR